jgi:hypothetical protein
LWWFGSGCNYWLKLVGWYSTGEFIVSELGETVNFVREFAERVRFFRFAKWNLQDLTSGSCFSAVLMTVLPQRKETEAFLANRLVAMVVVITVAAV